MKKKGFLLMMALGIGCWLAGADRVAAQYVTSCQQAYNTCHGVAVENRDGCENQCDPGDQACLDACASTYNSDEAACQSQKNTCLSQRQNECTFSVCPQYCGSAAVSSCQYNDTTLACQTSCSCSSACSSFCGQNNPATQCQFNPSTHNCTISCSCSPYSRPTYCPGGPSAAYCASGNWFCSTPILVDMDGRGLQLTGCDNPVSFDLLDTGVPQLWSWTEPGAAEAWLAMDRNDDGIIDSGTELFGSATPQAPSESEAPNGFRALAAFDEPEAGGDGDGLLTRNDAVFPHLLLWRDLDHDGFSQPSELTSLTDTNISAIDMAHQEVGKRDRNGNYFRFRARVFTFDQGRSPLWSWDVFLQGCDAGR